MHYELAQRLCKGPYQTISTHDNTKLVYVPFSALVRSKSTINKVQSCSFNNKIALYEDNKRGVWILNDQLKFKYVGAHQFLTDECYSLEINVSFSENEILFYLK